MTGWVLHFVLFSEKTLTVNKYVVFNVGNPLEVVFMPLGICVVIVILEQILERKIQTVCLCLAEPEAVYLLLSLRFGTNWGNL